MIPSLPACFAVVNSSTNAVYITTRLNFITVPFNRSEGSEIGISSAGIMTFLIEDHALSLVVQMQIAVASNALVCARAVASQAFTTASSRTVSASKGSNNFYTSSVVACATRG